MARYVLLMVDYGENNSLHVAMFKEELKKSGWQEGMIEGAFHKAVERPDAEIETAMQEEVYSAANRAVFKKTCFELVVSNEDKTFCWDWNTP